MIIIVLQRDSCSTATELPRDPSTELILSCSTFTGETVICTTRSILTFSQFLRTASKICGDWCLIVLMSHPTPPPPQYNPSNRNGLRPLRVSFHVTSAMHNYTMCYLYHV